MAIQPSVSTRVHIKWGAGEPEERTNTLVLTSPSNLYVDLRFFKDPQTENGRLIDWAFGGLARKQGNLGTWDHWVDSRSDNPAEDSGVLTLLSNGDTLEKGVMLDDNGDLSNYEEVWRDQTVGHGFSAVYVCFQHDARKRLQTNDELDQRKPLDVLVSSPIASDDISGMLIRIDQWCQAILVNSGETTAERWVLDDDGWKLIYKCGDALLPSPLMCASPGDSSPAKTDTITTDGRQWILVELHEIEKKGIVSTCFFVTPFPQML